MIHRSRYRCALPSPNMCMLIESSIRIEENEVVLKRVGNVKEVVGSNRQRSGVRVRLRLRKWPRESRERYVVWQASQSFSCIALVNPALRAIHHTFHHGAMF